MDAKEVLQKLGAIERQRKLVQSANIGEAMKARLCAELDGQVRLLDEALKVIEANSGAVQAPQPSVSSASSQAKPAALGSTR